MSTPSAPVAPRPLRVLQSAACFKGWGGCELHLLNLSEELKKRGHTVTIAAIPGEYVATEAHKRGIATIPLHQRKRYEWSLLPTWRDRIREQGFDVVHVHGSRDYVVPTLAAKQCGVPAVLMTRHFPKPIRFPQNVLYRTVLLDHVIAVSESVRAALLRSGFPERRASTVHHCTNLEAFSPDAVTVASSVTRADWGIAPGDTRCVVGFAARFVPDKGGDILLKALANVPETVAILLGDGEQKAVWQRLADNLGIRERVVFAGFRSDIQNALNALDVFVLPSVYPEPCAAVVQQAMAMGKPVIGTRIGGTPEMIRENETGLLVPAGNAPALSDALRTVAGLTPRERGAMGARGRARVQAYFALGTMAERTESLYYQIIAAKGATL